MKPSILTQPHNQLNVAPCCSFFSWYLSQRAEYSGTGINMSHLGVNQTSFKTWPTVGSSPIRENRAIQWQNIRDISQQSEINLVILRKNKQGVYSMIVYWTQVCEDRARLGISFLIQVRWATIGMFKSTDLICRLTA